MLRTFIAVDFPPETLTKIINIIGYFKTLTPMDALKWVSAENLHLTIKFIGDIPKDKLVQIRTIIKEALIDKPQFKIGIGGLGMYPNKHNPRVIWLGVTYDQTLRDIHHVLNHSLKSAGIEPDNRDYSPHLTIARIRQRTRDETRQDIGATLSKFKVDSLGEIKINEIILYQSELTRKGPIYTPLLSQPLNQV